MLTRRPYIIPFMFMGIAFALLGAGCIFSPDDDVVPPPPPEEIPAPTSPENLLKAMKVIYNDKVRTATERRDAYDNILGSSFIFRFQAVDFDSCGCTDWGRDQDIQSAANIFQLQDSGDIFSLRLDLTFDPGDGGMGAPLDPPDPNRPDWRKIFVSSTNVELLTSPGNGFAVQGGQAEFLFQPLNNRWYIADWTDLPRP